MSRLRRIAIASLLAGGTAAGLLGPRAPAQPRDEAGASEEGFVDSPWVGEVWLDGETLAAGAEPPLQGDPDGLEPIPAWPGIEDAAPLPAAPDAADRGRASRERADGVALVRRMLALRARLRER